MLKNIWNLVPYSTKKLLLVSLLLGFFWFGIEYSLIFVIQYFFLSLNMIGASDLKFTYNLGADPNLGFVLLLAFGLLRAVVYSFRIFISGKIYSDFITHMRMSVGEFAVFRATSISSYKIQALFGETVQSSGQVIQYIGLIANNLVVSFFLLIAALMLAPFEVCIGLAFPLTIVFPIKNFSRKMDAHGTSLKNEWFSLNEILSTSIRNNNFLLINGLLGKQVTKIKMSLSRYNESYKNFTLINGINSSLPMLLGVVCITLMSYSSVNFFKTPTTNIIPALYLFVRFSQSVSELSGNTSMVRLYFPTIKELVTFFDFVKSDGYVSNQIKMEIDGNVEEINFRDVCFNYPEQKNTLEQMNLTLRQGDCLIIKGPSGAGKTTLLKLIMGVIEPTSGVIKVNKELFECSKSQFWSQISYAGTEPFLVEGTLEENLTLGMYKLDTLQAENILRELGLGEVFDLNSNFLSLKLDEVSRLSTGQRQRISLARFFLKPANVYIFDEGTSNLDLENEEAVKKLIKSLNNKIVVIVSHRASFDDIGTNIIKIEGRNL